MKLNIKSKEYGLHWGLECFKIASEIFSISRDVLFSDSIYREYEFNDDGSIKSVGKDIRVREEVIFGALINWCNENNEKFEATPSNFVNAYNDFTKEQQQEILESFKKSMYVGEVVEDIFKELLSKIPKKEEAETVKKKASTRKSLKIVSNGE